MNNLPSSSKAAPSRRKFLGTALAGTAATLAGAASMSFFLHRTRPRPEQPHSRQGPPDGNERFASGRLTSFDEDLKILRDHTVDQQEPFAAVLSYVSAVEEIGGCLTVPLLRQFKR
jgi:carbonic anhydrase